MSTSKLGPLAVILTLALVIFYFGVVVLFGIWFAGSIVSMAGFSLSSNLGMNIAIIGASLYIAFEMFILYNGRPPPVMQIILTIITIPFTISRGMGVISREFGRIQDLLANIAGTLSHIFPNWATR
jgi:hypothetical protein